VIEPSKIDHLPTGPPLAAVRFRPRHPFGGLTSFTRQTDRLALELSFQYSDPMCGARPSTTFSKVTAVYGSKLRLSSITLLIGDLVKTY